MASTKPAFNFRLDPSSLPKLGSRGENYPEWRSAWTIAFRYAGIWPILSGKKPRPISNLDADEWDEGDNKALVMLLSSVHNDLTMSVASCDTSPEAWKHLANRFDRDTGNASILLFRSLTNLRYRDGDDLRIHLDEFHQRWTRMSKRCATSTQPVAVAMRAMFDSDQVKGSFFLATLPETMDNVIDNLSTRNVTAFQDIEPKILDISEKHSLDVVDSSAAYAARQTASRKPASTKPPNGVLECTWCRKHDLPFVGHLYPTCYALKKHKESQAKGDAPTNSKKQKANNAAAVEPPGEAEESDGSITVVGYSAHACIDLTASSPPSRPLLNSNGKRSRPR